MLYLSPACGEPVREAMRSGELGHLRQPWGDRDKAMPDVTWAADNGCFNRSNFVEAEWLDWLDDQPRTALWATVPDVVGDAAATLDEWERLAQVVKGLGFRAAWVAQDGARSIPDDADAVFLGGTDDFKLGSQARLIAGMALDQSLPLHMGRVNSRKRWRLAGDLGCDTVDGTFLLFAPIGNLERMRDWWSTPSLFGY